MTVPCIYPNEVAVLLATGPSLTEEVIETIRPYHNSGKVRVFGCNDSYKLCNFLDVHYACDKAWWEYNGMDTLHNLPSTCHVWTQDPESAQKFHINHISGEHRKGLYIKDRNLIYFGSNSGFQLLNLAYHYGIRKFLLAGYNMTPVGDKNHFFGNHPSKLQKSSPYGKFVLEFATIQKEIRELVINCTPNSALTCFVKRDLKEVLEHEFSLP